MSGFVLIVLMSLLGVGLAITQMLLKTFLKLFLSFQGEILDKIFLSVQSYLFWATLASFLVCSGLWIWILPRVKLSIVYPIISLSYVAMLFLAYFIEHEPIHWTNIFGVLLIIGGVIFLSCGR